MEQRRQSPRIHLQLGKDRLNVSQQNFARLSIWTTTKIFLVQRHWIPTRNGSSQRGKTNSRRSNNDQLRFVCSHLKHISIDRFVLGEIKFDQRMWSFAQGSSDRFLVHDFIRSVSVPRISRRDDQRRTPTSHRPINDRSVVHAQLINRIWLFFF